MGKFFYILLTVGGAQGLLLTVALLTVRRGNRKANRILAIVLFFFSCLILIHAGGHPHEQPYIVDSHEWMGHAFFFLIAPLLYFYTKALTLYNFKLHHRDSLHLLPCISAAIVFFFLGSTYIIKHWDFIELIILILMAIQIIIYLIQMLYELRNYTNTIENTFSSLEKINLHWLRFFVIGQIIVWSITLIINLSSESSKERGLTWLPVSIFMYLIGYFGLRQPEIFSGEILSEKSPAQNGKKKYEKSALTAVHAESILRRLHAFMETSKPYINPALTLPVLSKQMNVSPNHLSQVINEKMGKNFFEFINYYRIEEAKILLKNPDKQHLTLAAIGFESGFNSVSSFNSIFKKVTACTPSQYRLSGNPK